MIISRRFSVVRPLLEASALIAPALLFLQKYTELGMPKIGAHTAHFQLLGTAWIIVLTARLAAWRVAPSRVACMLATLPCLLMWSLLVFYYTVATVGLQGWGGIITWPILRPYLTDPSDLLDYLGVSTVAALFVAVLWLALAGLFWFVVVGRDDWLDRLQRRLSSPLYWVLLCACALFAGHGVERFLATPAVSVGEPLSLTFFPLPPIKYGQAMWPSDPKQLEEENASRAALTAARPLIRPNVILIVSDALRADRMGVYRYTRATTPFLSARLASAGSKERIRAIAACAETRCGMPALLYSKIPNRMVRGALGLSEVLKRVGYKSHMLLSGDHTNYYGLAELYKPSDSFSDATTQERRFVNDDRMVLDAVAALPRGEGNKPVFLQIGLLSNHPLGVRLPGSDRYRPQGNYFRWGKRKDNARLTAEERQLAANFYDNGVRQADRMIDLILRRLDAKGYLETALVIVTSDHGEMLGEHNRLLHPVGVFQQLLDIPAIFIRYGYSSPRFPVRTWVSQIDIAPTIVQDLGVAPPATWEGIPLQDQDKRRYLFFQQGDETGFVCLAPPYSGFKYWVDRRTGQEFVFNLTADFGEQSNLIASIVPATRNAWRELVQGPTAASNLLH